MSLADVLTPGLPWCRAADTMRMCHWLAMDTILWARCVILAAPNRHMKNPLSCTDEPTCNNAAMLVCTT